MTKILYCSDLKSTPPYPASITTEDIIDAKSQFSLDFKEDKLNSKQNEFLIYITKLKSISD